MNTNIPGPGSINAKRSNRAKSGSEDKVKDGQDSKGKANKDAAAIWTPGEVPTGESGDILVPDVSSDPRETPVFDIYFQQHVTTEDVFLQMGNKTPSTASCESMCVDILLPEENDFNKIQLDLKFQSVELRSPKYILILPLPHPINPRAGKAKWHPELHKLALNLILTRELDAFNF